MNNTTIMLELSEDDRERLGLIMDHIAEYEGRDRDSLNIVRMVRRMFREGMDEYGVTTKLDRERLECLKREKIAHEFMGRSANFNEELFVNALLREPDPEVDEHDPEVDEHDPEVDEHDPEVIG